MRLFKVFSLLALLFGAHASSLDSRSPAAPHPLDARQLLDVCASVNTDLVVPDLLGVLTAVGVIDVCLCLSALPLFLETNVVAVLGVTIAGERTVTDILTQLINNAASSSGCVYPDNSIPACVNGNPCGFQCTGGFTPSPPNNPTTCACEAPSVVCNGKCVAAGSCPSGAPQKKKRWVGSGSCTEMGPEWAACGVFGGGARAWECIDTARDLESCGGCVLPLTPYTPVGQDCTALPGVADVSCLAGECVVHRCLRGYVHAHDGTHCVSKHSKGSHPYVAEDEAELARVYGLEHVPLQKY